MNFVLKNTENIYLDTKDISMNEIFKSQPKFFLEGIPVFSDLNDPYVENYNKIAEDHVKAISNGIENPYIDKELWDEMESSTVMLATKYIEQIEEETIKVLDVGVGLGRLITKICSNIKNKQIEYFGIDIALPYLKISSKKNINVALSKIEDIPYKDEFFDVILCTDVLEHVIDLNEAIRKILSVLKRGGYLIVRVPNKEDLSLYLTKDYPYYYVHLRNFDKYSLELLFTRIFNLEVVEFSNGGYAQVSTLLKYKVPVKGYNLLIQLIGDFIKNVSKNTYKKFLKLFYEPIEINCVVKKR